MLDQVEADIESLPENDRPYAWRFAERLRDGDPTAERVMRQHEAGGLRANEAIRIGGCPRPEPD